MKIKSITCAALSAALLLPAYAQTASDAPPSNPLSNLFQGLGQALQKLGTQGQDGKAPEGAVQNTEKAADQTASATSPYKWTSWANRTFAPEVEEGAAHLRVGYSAYWPRKETWQYYATLTQTYQTCDLVYLYAIYSKSSLSEREMFECGVHEYLVATLTKDGIQATDPFHSRIAEYVRDQYNQKTEAQRYALLVKERMDYLAKAKRYYFMGKPTRVAVVDPLTNSVAMTFSFPMNFYPLPESGSFSPLLMVSIIRSDMDESAGIFFQGRIGEESARVLEFSRTRSLNDSAFGPTKISFNVSATKLNKFGEKVLIISKLGTDVFLVNSSGEYKSIMFKVD